MSVEPDQPYEPRIPDGIEPIVAYRAWSCATGAEHLRSVTGASVWQPGAWTVATCRRPGTDRHASPAEGCTCGLYAMKDLANLMRQLDLSLAGRRGPNGWSPVIGKVELAGVVIEHDHGYRAQLGRVVEILPTSGHRDDAERVARAYGVPVGEEVRAPKASFARYGTALPWRAGALGVPAWAPRSRTSQVLLACYVIGLVALSVGSALTGHPGWCFFPMWWAIRGGSLLAASRRRGKPVSPPAPRTPPPGSLGPPGSHPPNPPGGSSG